MTTFNEEERPLIELYNQMSFLTAIATISISIFSFFFGFPIEYTIITILVTVYYISLISLNHFGHFQATRFVTSILSPILVCATHLLIGGDFNQGLLVVTVLVITYVSFDRDPVYRMYLMAFTIISYLGTLFYSYNREPILGKIDLPYDEILAFFMASCWLGRVILAFLKNREELIKDLQSKNKKLKHTTEELERFTYIASHDLKSPLRTINSFLGLIERDIRKKNYEALPDRLDFVKSGAKQMNTLIEDILEISILNNPEKKKKREVDLNVVAEKVCTILKEDISAKNASLIIEKLPTYNCDEAEFLLLFQNMIQNGIKYNENPNPQIKVSAQENDTQIKISFEDNGIGIEEEYQEQIFQFFKRLHTSDKYTGTGLGLGLCKKIVKSYNGDIKVNSETGKGSTFQIILEREAANN